MLSREICSKLLPNERLCDVEKYLQRIPSPPKCTLVDAVGHGISTKYVGVIKYITT